MTRMEENSVFTYKDKMYKVLNDDTLFKHPETREWVGAIYYEQIESGKKFVREKEEFYKLFKRVWS